MYDLEHPPSSSSDEDSDGDSGLSARSRRRISIMTNKYFSAPQAPKRGYPTGRRFFEKPSEDVEAESEEDRWAMRIDGDEGDSDEEANR